MVLRRFLSATIVAVCIACPAIAEPLPKALHPEEVGFGLGFAVRTDVGRNPMPGSVGEFYWTGSAGTTFWVDPKESLVAVLMVQVPINQTVYYRSLVRNMVYQAFTK